ncbi:MAG: type III pantothenate kinase, partial [Bacteroidota bacterium]
MNLVIDIGNTAVKVAVFKEEDLVFQERSDIDTLELRMMSLYKRYSIQYAIVSNVSKLPETLMDALSRQYSLHILTHNSKVPFKNCYATPETLGVDRIALASAASYQFPDKNVLIIDAGSCITYEFINAENNYLGGAISPGIQMRYKALHTFTGHLPLLQPDIFSDVTGNTTASSIHSGILNGIINEIEGIIAQYKEKYA